MRLDLDDPAGFTTVHMYTVRKVLQRLPRHVTKLTPQRFVRRVLCTHRFPGGEWEGMGGFIFAECWWEEVVVGRKNAGAKCTNCRWRMVRDSDPDREANKVQ